MTEETFELRFEPEGLQIIPVGELRERGEAWFDNFSKFSLCFRS